MTFTANLCYLIQAMCLIAVTSARSIFAVFFYKKNKKAGLAQKKAGKLYMLLFF